MPVSEHRIALPTRYRVVRHIANGGMASVWLAEDEVLGRRVAVKVLAAGYAEDERANRRFVREARAGARLSECRHVVTVYDIGEHDGRPFMVMEYFSGGTVADRLRSGRDVPRALALRWLREAADALDCAHGHDVVHRDVKPANLLIDERGRLAVGDFGIATVATEASLTQTGQVLGTAAYISPSRRAATLRPTPATATRWPSSPSSCSPVGGPSRPTTRPPRPAPTSRRACPRPARPAPGCRRAWIRCSRPGWPRTPRSARRPPLPSWTPSRSPSTASPPPPARRRR